MFSIMEKIWGVFLLLDGVIYDLVDWVYRIFISLARLNLFDDASYNRIVGRIYIVLGVFMLFVLAYSLLKAVINPDEFAKGEASFPNLIKNVVISLIIIAVLPTVFTYAYNIQNAILNQGTIPQLIFGNSNASDIDGGGATMAYWTFRAFFNPDPSFCQKNGIDASTFDGLTNCAEQIEANSSALEKLAEWLNMTEIQSLKDVYAKAEEYSNDSNINWSFTRFTAFSEAVDRGDVRYVFIISTLVGIAMFLILLTYCISLALRAIKLMVFQIIAPIPVICRIMPGDKKKVFDNWVKQIIGTFVDVFLRVAILYLGVFLIQEICEKFGRGGSSLVGLGVFQKLFAIAFLIIGVLMFVRQAPGMLKDLFGFDLGGGTLNPFKIFNDAVGASAILASPAVGLVQGIRNYRRTRADGKSVGKSLLSGMGGAGSAAARMAWNSRNAHNWHEASEAAGRSTRGAEAQRSYRAEYARKHPGESTLMAHARDRFDWLIGKSAEQYDGIIKAADSVNSANDNFRAAAKKQWDKHSTDSDLLFAMSTVDANGNLEYDANGHVKDNKFKGVGADRMAEFYQDYRSRGMSASAISEDIKARRTAHQKTDYEALAREELGEFDERNLTQEQVAEMNARCYRTKSDGTQEFDDAEYAKFISDLTKRHQDNILNLAAQKRNAIATELSYLDSMNAQMEKFNVTQIADIAMKENIADRHVGSITASDLYETNQLGHVLEDSITSSGLASRNKNGQVVMSDPAKFDPNNPGQEEVVLDRSNLAKSMDDMAGAAANIKNDAILAKQSFLEKKSDNHGGGHH